MSLDWDILIGILGFIFFIIVPAFTRKKPPQKKEQPGTPPATQKTAAPQQQRAAPGQGRAALTQRAGGSQQPAQPVAPEPGSLAELLESIRQQVSEAQAQETGSPAARTERQAPQRPAVDPAVVPPGPHSSQPAPLLSSPERRLRDLGARKEGSTPQGLGRIRPKARRASVRTFADTPEEKPVVARVLVKVDKQSVIQGLIWHEILSEPKGIRGMRRSKLPLR